MLVCLQYNNSNIYKAICQICCLSTPNCIKVWLTTAVYDVKRCFYMYGLVLQICWIRLDICISIGLLRNLDAWTWMHNNDFQSTVFYIPSSWSSRTLAAISSSPLFYILIFTLSQKYQYFLKIRDSYVLVATQTHILFNLSEARTSAKYCINLVEPLTNAEETLKCLLHTKTFGVLIKQM